MSMPTYDATRWDGLCSAIVGEYFAPGLSREDLMQEARLATAIAVRDFRPDGGRELSAWVSFVVRRRVQAAVKMATRAKHGPLNESVRVIVAGDGEEVDALELVAAPASDPVETLVGRERWRVVRGAFADLSELETAALVMTLNGESYAAMAERCGVTTRSIDNALQRAKHKLRAALRDFEAGNPTRGGELSETTTPAPATTPAPKVIQEAMAKLEARRERLEAIVEPAQRELKEIERAMRALERAGGTAQKRSNGAASSGAGAKRADVLAVIVEHREEGITHEQIGERLGTRRGLHFTLGALVRSGLVTETAGRYRPTGKGLKRAQADARGESIEDAAA